MKKKICFIFSMMFSVSLALMAGTNYYVDSTRGNDSYNGLTTGTAWKTINKANLALKAGDTVYIRGGTYEEDNGWGTIKPSYSGSAGNYITYRDYLGEKVIIRSTKAGSNLNMLVWIPTNINYIRLTGLTLTGVSFADSSLSHVIHLNGSYNVIQDCAIEYANEYWCGVMIPAESHHNQILDNTIRYIGENTADSGGDGVKIFGRYNLIQGNDIDYCGHNDIQDDGKMNIIRANIMEGHFWRGANLQSSADEPNYSVFEDNIIHNVIGITDWGTGTPGYQMSGSGSVIFRRNRIYDIDGDGVIFYTDSTYPGRNHRFYNNVLYNCGRISSSGSGHAVALHESINGTLSDIVFKNNIFYGNLHDGVRYEFYATANEHSFANNAWNPTNPKFVNEPGRDFRLQPDSPCRNAGNWLTIVTSASGSGRVFVVADSRYFTDGLGLIEGDMIQLQGQTQTARIIGIDHGSRTITVNDTLSWTTGQGVSLAYSGSAPDLGAFEQVGAELIEAALSASPASGMAPLGVTFTGSASGGTPPYSYGWDFGDGSISSIQNPGHTYSSSGNYVATLSVTDQTGTISRKTANITVYQTTGSMSVSASASPRSGQAPLAVTFTGAASGGTPPYTYSWSFGDQQTSAQQNPSHTYSSAGSYTATMTVIDSLLALKTAMISITVSTAPNALIVSISASPTSGPAPLAVSFSGSATGGTTPYGYRWEFGDGQTSTASSPAHTYGGAGTYSAVLTVTDSKNLTDQKTAVITVSTAATQPNFICTPDSLAFGATTSGQKTHNQHFRILKNGTGPLTWSVQKNAGWLACSPLTGTGDGKVTVSIDPSGLPAGTHSAAITILSQEASPASRTLNITVRVSQQDGQPVGFLDTPAEGSMVTGSVSVSGWALDDVEVAKVEIKRDPVSVDSPGSVGPDGLVFIGNAVFVEGARPDVEERFPDIPLNSRAGWGYMLLTYGLPGRGNGAFSIYAVAADSAGHQTVLGRKSIYADNAHSKNPFGTIDSPGQGDTIGGAGYYNFGWALTPLPKTIPTDGSTISVWIDGVKIGNATYNQYRKDIADAYPDYNNAQGAVGYFLLDTTKYENGVHTIGWSVRDNQGQEAGIGSRYFSVDNNGQGNAGLKAMIPATFEAFKTAETLKIGIREVKKGYLLKPAAEKFWSTADVQEIIIEEMEPLQIAISGYGNQGLKYAGWEGETDLRRTLPIGSTLDSQKGLFSWIPTPGFIGSYLLNFAAENGSNLSDPVQIRVTVVPKRSF